MFRRLLKHALRPVAAPLLNRLTDRVAERIEMRVPEGPLPVPESPSPVPESPPQAPAEVLRRAGEQTEPFDLRVLAAARAVAASGDHRIILPTDTARLKKKPEEIKIGYFGNIANNAHIFTKCLRRLGYRAELVIEDGGFDAFLLNRPFWEDVEVECSSYEEGLTYESKWVQPHYVRRVAYDTEMQARYEGRYSAIPEIQDLYREAFRLELPPDRALLLAQNMGHWPHLLATKQYDVIQYSGAPISMGAFCPRPYVVFPTGSDLFISPFEESPFGVLMRAGYRWASHIIIAEPNYPTYLDRLLTTASRTYLPLMVDTETYRPEGADQLRSKWKTDLGGRRFILSVCRQSWFWKGNDRLIRAFRKVAQEGDETWRLVLSEWGPDVRNTKWLVKELGLEDKVSWERLCSKSLLRVRQRAADLVVDQVVMPGYGTSVLECMAAGKPVVLCPQSAELLSCFPTMPPFLFASTPDEIAKQVSSHTEEDPLSKQSAESLDWLRRHHGYDVLAHKYISVYHSVS